MDKKRQNARRGRRDFGGRSVTAWQSEAKSLTVHRCETLLRRPTTRYANPSLLFWRSGVFGGENQGAILGSNSAYFEVRCWIVSAHSFEQRCLHSTAVHRRR